MTTRLLTTVLAATLAAAPAFGQSREVALALAAVDRAAAAIDVAQSQSERAREAEERGREQEQREKERADRQRDRESDAFDRARDQLDSERWERAIDGFNQVVALKGTRADGALYWKAYAQDRLGQRSEALATIAELTKTYPKSGYLKQAQALEMEVRRKAGQPVNPDDQKDEDLKLLALNSVMNSDPERAIPLLEKVLQGPSSPKLRSKAVFVLAQSNSPKARQILRDLARGSSGPELQNQAIQQLGVMGGAESRAILAEVYTSSTDVDVKRRILRAFMVSGEKQRLFAAAQSEQNADLRNGGRPAARRDGRTRRALAALSEGVVRRRQEADPSGDVRRRRLDAPHRPRQVREGSRASRHRRAEPRADGRSRRLPRPCSTSTAPTRIRP